MTFLFWNINRKNLLPHIAALVGEYDADVLMLCEVTIPVADVLQALNPPGSPAVWEFCPSFAATDPILFIRGAARFVVPLTDIEHLTLRLMSFPGTPPFLLGLVHLPSQMYTEENQRAAQAGEIASAIREKEIEQGHTRTILVGDFNMNPFEDGLTAWNSLNAIMTRADARKEFRKDHLYFFNPMWRFFGDGEEEVPGTYYYASNKLKSLHWHIFDQVIVRPRLMDQLPTAEIAIITKTRCGSLLEMGVPGQSDHLPLKFTLNT